jgi:putative heme-binding domain-containing protein
MPQRKIDPQGSGPEQWIAQIDSESYYERRDAQAAIERMGREGRKALTDALAKKRPGTRGRLHALWALAHLGGQAAINDLIGIATSDPEASVRAQAVRAVADLADPVLTRHRLNAGPGDVDLAARLAALGKGQDSRVLLEVIIALGRLRWAGLADWLSQNLGKPDASLAHAAQQALRRSESWSAILQLLDEPDSTPIRAIALRAVAERFEPTLVDGLIERLRRDPTAVRRREYADALTRVCKKPGPWIYWGYRPPPRRANTVVWERTEAIAEALDRVLADPDRAVRLAVLQRMQREKVPIGLATLSRWLQDEHQPEAVAAILASLGDGPVAEVRHSLETVVQDRRHSPANREAALALFVRGLDEVSPAPLLALAQALEDGPILADALRSIGKYPKLPAVPLLTRKLSSPEAEVRAAAIEALGKLQATEGCVPLLTLLQDKDVRVRRAAVGAAGDLGAKQAIEPLLKLVTDTDPAVRRASFDSLRRLREPRAVPLAVAALSDRQVEIKALECLRELGSPEQARAVTEWAKRNPSTDVLAATVRVLTAWRDRKGLTAAERKELDRAVAEVQGSAGILLRWTVRGPLSAQVASGIIERFASVGLEDDTTGWRTQLTDGTETRVMLASKDGAKDAVWLAYTDVIVPEPTAVEFQASSRGSLQVWLNGRSLHRREPAQNSQIDFDRFAGMFAKGVNRLLVQVGPSEAAVEFHLHFRRKSATAERERLMETALARAGNPQRGRKLFFDVEKSQCLKCHRLGEQGERIGPELTGVGGRFSRIYIVESILEPSRTIAPSFATLTLVLTNGKTLTGVKVVETETMLTLADNQGQKHLVVKTDIEEQQASVVSTMPEELEKRFSRDEFVDLIAFLMSQKEDRGPATGGKVETKP